jgi:hypothetical protein
MTQDEIIRIARVAGVRDDGHRFEFSEYKQLERFANLVAAAEREACLDAMLQSAAKAVDTAMALEREACAKLIEAYPEWLGTVAKKEIAAAIRARSGEKK